MSCVPWDVPIAITISAHRVYIQITTLTGESVWRLLNAVLPGVLPFAMIPTRDGHPVNFQPENREIGPIIIIPRAIE